MIKNNSLTIVQPLIKKYLTPYFNRSEKILMLLLLISVVIRITNQMALFALYDITLMLLSLVYFFNAFSPLPERIDDDKTRFIHYIGYWALSTGFIGILYKTRCFPGATLMLTLAAIISLILGFYAIFIMAKESDKSSFLKPLIIRALIFGLVFLLLRFVPKQLLIEVNLIYCPVIN